MLLKRWAGHTLFPGTVAALVVLVNPVVLPDSLDAVLGSRLSSIAR